jgi:alkylation response protein AidB-like acyl-CoA dehydrogenase
VDFELSAEQKEIQALARDFAQREIEPHAATWDREHTFPRDVFAKLAELGLMGTCVPEEYGGAGTDFLSYVLALEELSRADAGVGVTVAVHTSAVTLPLLTFGTDEQRSRFVPPLARGEHLGAFALTEPEAGSDAYHVQSRAVLQPDGSWVLNGEKRWIGNGGRGSVFVDGVFIAIAPALYVPIKPGKHDIEIRDGERVRARGVLTIPNNASDVVVRVF